MYNALMSMSDLVYRPSADEFCVAASSGYHLRHADAYRQ